MSIAFAKHRAFRKLTAFAGLLMLGLAGCASQPTGGGPQAGDFVWPAPPNPTRLSYVMSVASSEQFEEKKQSLKDRLLGEESTSTEGLSLVKPYAVYADGRGRVFVTDTAQGALVVFDLKENKVSAWGNYGRGTLSKPVGVTSDRAGNIYVVDSASKRLVIFGPNGAYVGGSSNEVEFGRPVGVAVDDERGRIYITDSQRHHIVVLDMNGDLIETIGESGKGPLQFNYPTHLTLDRQSRLNVVDSLNHRVQIINPDGSFVRAFGEHNDTSGNFVRPRGIGVDSDGNIYVADAAFNNFQIFNDQGQLLLFVGGAGNRPGQFVMPAGIAVDSKDRLYVVDQFNHRVEVFQYHSD